MRASLLPFLVALAACGDKEADDTAAASGSAPVAVVVSPGDGDTLLSGRIVTLEGVVDDSEDAAEALTVSWILDGEEACAAAAPDTDGSTTCDVAVPDLDDLSGDTVTIELTVVDADGETDTASVGVRVQSGEAPEATILSPDDQAVAYADTPLLLTGVASDDLDAPSELVATWASDAQGGLATVPVASDGAADAEVLLDVGTHTLTLSVEDTAGMTGEDSVTIEVFDTNTEPSCGITTPVDGSAAQPGDVVTFTADVADAEDGPTGLVATWSSDRDGTLGSSSPGGFDIIEAELSGLSEGLHTLTLDVVDSGGLTCTDAIVFTVGDAPEVTLSTPSDGDVYDVGAPVTLAATFSDDRDAPDALTVDWESDVDGLLATTTPDADGTGAYTTTALSTGPHTLTVRATDSDGFSNAVAVDITVNGLPTAPTVSLSPDPAVTTDDLTVSVDVDSVDPEGDPVTYAYAWWVDGVASAETSDTLAASEHAAGQQVEVAVTPNDGTSAGTPGTASLTIGNTAPTVALATLSPDPAVEGDTLVCAAGATSDVDGDAVSVAYTWTVDGASVAATSDTLDDSFWGKGDSVVCTVTPSDGTDAGTAVASNTVVIGNAAPSVLSVEIDPASPGVADDLTCGYAGFSDPDGDADQSTYAWTINGTAAGSTDTLAAGAFSTGDTVVCTVTPDDGTDTGADVSATVVIGNSAPSISSVSISPASASVGDTLTCSYSGYSDADGDADESTYRWTVDGTEVGTTSTLSGGFVGGDTVSCTVTPYDGASTGTSLSDSLVVDNTLPVLASVVLSPDPAYAGDTLTCAPGSTSDADGDSVTLSYAWTVAGSTVPVTGATLGDAFWSRGEAVVCTVTPSDGVGSGAGVDSNTVTISNSLPSVSTVSVSPSTPTVSDTLTCSYTGFSDADGDADQSTYSWSVSGTVIGTGSALSSGFSAGDTVTCSVTPYDGVGSGAAATDAVTIFNTPPTITSVSVTPVDPLVSETLTCAATGSDVDGDTVTITYAWDVAGVTVGTGSTLSGGFVKGDVVTCTATPSDGTTNGPSDDDAVTVDNTAPSVSTVSVSPSDPTVSDALTCSYTGFSDDDGDADQSTLSWTIGGVEVGTGTTLSSGFSSGDTVTCTVTPDDGDDTGTAVSDSVDVQNEAPTITSISVTPATPTVEDTLTCTVSTADADGDAVTVAYSWTVSGVEVGTSSTLSSGFSSGDTVTCTATPNDGTDDGASDADSVSVDNALPVVASVTLSPTTATETDTLTCTVGTTTDADGDSVSLSYAWTVDGSSIGSTSSTLTGTDFDRDQAVVCTVTPNDGTDDGAAVDSNSVTIANTPPAMASVAITPATAASTDTLTCTPSATDDDGDTVSYAYSWTLAGTEIGTASTLSSGFTAGDAVTCTVTPTDGTDAGAAVADTITIVNTPPVIGTVTVSPSSPVVTDALSCAATGTDVDGDTVSFGYSWTVGGVEIGTTASISSGYSAGDTVVCAVTPNDGTDDGATGSDSVTVLNTAPVMSSVSLTPTTPLEADTLSCAPTATDVDGDTLTYTYAWTVGGSAISATTGTLTGADFDRGEGVSCTVTPNDGTTDGTAMTSNTVTVGNTAPAIASVTVTPSTPLVTDSLTCSYTGYADDDGDSDASTYSWTIAGVEVGTSSTLSSGFAKNETVTCTVTPFDGTDAGTAISDSVSVDNTLPVLTSVTVDPASPTESDTVTCSATATDDDGDTVSFSYAWLVGGSSISATTSSLTGADFDKDQTITCTVTPNDGEDDGGPLSDSVTSVNTAPVMTAVTLTPDPAYEDDTVTCTPAATDDDSDTLTYTYAWTVNGSSVSPTTSTLDGDDFDHGDLVVCTVTPDDGSVSGTALASSALTITNSAPVIGSVTITPPSATAADTLTCTPTGSDADGDTINYAYSWTIAGTEVGTAQTLAGSFVGGDTVICTVTPSDEDDTGTARAGTSVIQNTAPTVTAVTIGQTDPTAEDTLTCSATGTDVDGDTVFFSYEWTVAGSTIGTGSSISSGYGRGDTVVCAATPTDGADDGTAGSASVVIANAVPIVSSVTIAPTDPTEASTLTISYTTSDADGDTVSVTFAWFVNGSQVHTGSTLDVGTYAGSGDDIEVRLTPNDGTEDGLVGVSNSVEVANSAPTAPTVDATDDPVEGVDDIVCEITAASTDADGDSISYVFSWEADGSVYPDDFGAATGPDTTTYTDDTIPAADTSLATEWECFVYADDGIDISADGTDTATVQPGSGVLSGTRDTIASSCPIADTHNSAFALAQSFTTTGSVTVTGFGIGFDTASSSQCGTCTFAVYDDSSGPDTLLGEASFDCSAGGVVTHTLATSFTLPSAGTYWVAHSGDSCSGSASNFKVCESTTAADTFYDSHTSGAMPDPFGSTSYTDTEFATWVLGY